MLTFVVRHFRKTKIQILAVAYKDTIEYTSISGETCQTIFKRVVA